jgi:hypothetical protein
MTRTETIQRTDPLTMDQWHRLPWLLPRAVVLEWTGLTDRELGREVKAGRITQFRGPSKKGKYFKTEIARLIRLPAGNPPPPSDAR